MSSTLPSDFDSRNGYDTLSNTGTNPRSANDGVWIQDDSRAPSMNDRYSGNVSVSGITKTALGAPSATGTAHSTGTWPAFPPIEQTYRQKFRQSSTAGSTNTGFAKQGAYKEDLHTRAQNKYDKDKAKRDEAEEQGGNSERDDDDDDDTDFSL